MKRACLQQNTNTYEQNHASSIRPIKINFVRMKISQLIIFRDQASFNLSVHHYTAWCMDMHGKGQYRLRAFS